MTSAQLLDDVGNLLGQVGILDNISDILADVVESGIADGAARRLARCWYVQTRQGVIEVEGAEDVGDVIDDLGCVDQVEAAATATASGKGIAFAKGLGDVDEVFAHGGNLVGAQQVFAGIGISALVILALALGWLIGPLGGEVVKVEGVDDVL